jgi:hypothetical protein
MGLVDWTALSGKKDSNGVKYIKLEPGKTFRIRPVMKPHIIWKYYIDKPNGQRSSAITEDPVNCVIVKKYNEKPKQRFAVNVIDRSDGQLKVMEGPISILKQIGTWAAETNVDPGSNSGGEFAIRVECPGNDRKKTRYLVQFINYAPFNDNEKKMIKESIYNLSEVFKPAPQDKIESWLFGDGESDSNTNSSSQQDSNSSKKSKNNEEELSDDLNW